MKKKSISERAIIGFDHGLPCRVKNMALGPQLRQKPRPSASVFVYWVPRAMFFTWHERPWSNPTVIFPIKLCLSAYKRPIWPWQNGQILSTSTRISSMNRGRAIGKHLLQHLNLHIPTVWETFKSVRYCSNFLSFLITLHISQ